MENFTPLSATLGGLMIGGSAVFLMYSLGRIAGVSGILGGLFARIYPAKETGSDDSWNWQLAFVAGIIAAPIVIKLFSKNTPLVEIEAGYPLLIIAGLLVGYGTRLGSGCTSGHGICGMSRISIRSIVAVGIFMLVAVLTVFLTKVISGV